MTCPSRPCSSRPPGPLITDSITGLSGSESMITSQRSARSARSFADAAPQAGIRAGSASTASTSCPAATIRRVIRPPMLPVPTIPTGRRPAAGPCCAPWSCCAAGPCCTAIRLLLRDEVRTRDRGFSMSVAFYRI